MHKNTPIVNMEMDYDGNISEIGQVLQPEFLPLSVTRDKYILKKWLKERAIPRTRDGIATVLKESNEKSSQALLIRNLALSLNDTYWIKPVESDYTWDKVNLFTNTFNPSEVYSSMKKDSLGIYLNLSPNSSLQGELKKKWFIDENGKRILVKGNYGEGCQQSLNEVFSTLINKRQHKASFVEYTVREYSFDKDYQAFCCFCDNFISSDKTEFVPAWEIFEMNRYEQGEGDYLHFLNNCISLGMSEDYVKSFLSYQILLDYLITNVDRHMNNFGIIRDSETLKPLRMAPIFDCGNSMFYNQIAVQCNPKALDKIDTASFRKKETSLLELVTDFNLLDLSSLPSDEEIFNLFKLDKNLDEERIEEMIKCFRFKERRIKAMQKR